MAGFDLKEGEYRNRKVSEDELWKAFYLVFSTKTVNSSSYKFVFLKSIIDSLDLVDKDLLITFGQVFARFTEIYWVLVVKYGLYQGKSIKHETYLEQILHEFVGNSNGQASIRFDDLTDCAKNDIIKKVKSKCKNYVVGALYSDTNSLFYSFSKREEWIIINPQMYQFLQKHKDAIQELNYYELARFIEKVNATSTVVRMSTEICFDNQKDELSIYRQLLFKEFKETSVFNKKKKEINSLELLHLAEERYHKADAFEKENERMLSQHYEEDILDDDIQNMMMYLGDPERIIKMLKLRKGIC